MKYRLIRNLRRTSLGKQMKTGCLKIILSLGVIAVGLSWLGNIPGVGIASSFIAMMGGGIILGAADNFRYYDRPAQVVAIDRRCVAASSHINRFADMPSNSCSPEDIASRLAALNAPIPAPIRDGNSTHYPAKPEPEPGVAIVNVRYTDKSDVSRTATLTYPTMNRKFYGTEVGDTISVMVCRNDPSVIKTSILFHPKC